MSTKKYSVLNLVNCILLALTLTFSVISYAWYSPAEELGTPLSFSAGDTSNAITVTKITVSDAYLDDDPTVTVTDSGTRIGDEAFSADSLNFGIIDDLGVLKNSNVVYYCLTIPVSAGTDSYINLSYDTTLLNKVVTKDKQAADLHFNLYDLSSSDSPTLLTVDDPDTPTIYYHDQAKSKESFGDDPTTTDVTEGIKTFLAYSCAVSDIPPQTTQDGATTPISAKDLFDMFEDREKYSISSPSYDPKADDPKNADTQIVNVEPAETTGNYYYVYIKIYPDLDNYHELAQLLMDHMPFYVAFGTSLYVDVKPHTTTPEATEPEETQS